MTQTFNSFSDEFNATAKGYHAGIGADVNIAMLLTKYTLLQKHKATEPAEKARLAETLFNCAIETSQRLAKTDAEGAVKLQDESLSLRQICDKLLEPQSRMLLPGNSVSAMVDAGLELVRRAENCTERLQRKIPTTSMWEYKSVLNNYAMVYLEYADKFQEVAAATDVRTSGEMRVNKPLQLKAPTRA